MSPFLRLRGAHLTAHPLIEDFIFTALSLLVIAVALTAVFSPPEAILAASVNGAGGNVNPKQIAFYGTLVDENGQPIKNAEITISYSDGTKVSVARTKSDGSWSAQFNAGPGPYKVEVTVDINGTPVTGSIDIDASPGMRYGVQMTFAQPSNWVFVPLPGY